MRHILSLTALVALAACMGGGGTGVTSGAAGAGAGAASGPVAVDTAGFAELLNGVRAQNGADAVTYDARLAAAAQVHADDMSQNGFFSHVGSDGSTVAERVAAQGYRYRIVAENLAVGHQSEAHVMEGWTNSPGHHQNDINPAFEEFGLSRADGGGRPYWALVLATER